MFERSDEQLVKQALKNNKKAWFSLIKRYEQPVYQYCFRMTGNSYDASDLMQDVFMSVFRGLGSYREEGKFKSWLFRIAHFRCIEFYRKKRPDLDPNEAPEQVCQAACPEESMLLDSLNDSICRAMQILPIAQRAVVELKFFGQFTFDEISEQLGVSSNTVKSRLYAAMSKMKLNLEDEHAK